MPPAAVHTPDPSPGPALPHRDATVAVIGAGPAGLAAAEILAGAGARVTVYERMPSPARKLLYAGRGGLNLTHSEPLAKFLGRYGTDAGAIAGAVAAFPPAQLVRWADGLGQRTFVGSSGRIFPAAFKATPLLRAWLARLDALGVRFAFRHRWSGWDDDNRPIFDTLGGRSAVAADATLLALGGASWPRLGSDGSWVDILARNGIAVTPLKAANVGFTRQWSQHFLEKFEGEPLKRIAAQFGDERVRGEAVITRTGIEGGAFYAIGRSLRDAILRDGQATALVDLRPDISEDTLSRRLASNRAHQSLSTFLRKAAGLPPVAVALLRETVAGELPTAPFRLALTIKNVPLTLTGIGPIERAISTAGGIALDELDAAFMLRRLPGVFAAGEMLDWEAPTGGYLLQGCFSTGVAAAHGMLACLGREG